MARYRVGLETRARILAATRDLLAEEGLNDVTLKAITERAGIGAGSFYNLFDSKEAAILEVVRDAIEAVDPDPSGLERETVDDLVGAFVSFFVDERTSLAARIYLQLALAGAMTDEVLAARVRRHHEARVARFAAAIAREHQTLPAEDADTAAELLVGALVGAALVHLFDESRRLRDQAVELLAATRARLAQREAAPTA